MGFSDRRQHASQDFQAQVVFVAESVGTPLENPDLVVEALHETDVNGHPKVYQLWD